MRFFSEHLDTGVDVDGDGAAGNENLLRRTVVFVDSDNAWFQDGFKRKSESFRNCGESVRISAFLTQGWNVSGQDTKVTAE